MSPSVQTAPNQKPPEIAPKSTPAPSFFQEAKQSIKAIFVSDAAKTVAKEASFQAQMGIKKGVDKSTQVVGEFAQSGMRSAGDLFRGNSDYYPDNTDYVEYPDNDNYEYPEQPYDYNNQPGQTTPRYGGRPHLPGRSGRVSGLVKKSLWRNPFVIAGLIALFFILYSFFIENMLDSTAPLMAQVFNETPGGITESGTTTPEIGTTGDFCPTPEAISQNRDPLACRYLNPAVGLFDTNISQEGINNYIEKFSPVFVSAGIGDKAEFTRRTNYIIEQSKQAGLNPALFLGYWKSESGFSTIKTASDMGCAPKSESMRGFERQVQCALGLISGGASTAQCASSKDSSSPACLFEQGRITSNPTIFTNPPKIPISTFDDFAEMYGPKSQKLDPGVVNHNCSSTYNTLLEVVTLINSCQAPTQTIAGPIVPVGEQGSRIASVGMQVVNQLLHGTKDRAQILALGMNCDPGTSNGANGHYLGYHCWGEMVKKIYDIAQDPDYLQCTEFIIAVFDKAGFYDQINLIGGPGKGNARDWANNARKYPDKFQVFNDARMLQPGDIISIGAPGNAGHVALVIKREHNQVQVAQAATDQKLEDWFIDPQTGSLDPRYNYLSRQSTPYGGFIRLKDFQEKF